ncbi:hypothetical protein GQR58_009153 [Nymphon striatum]|nr:hypothetical protein GQR58_009153 [Nymphon striatum]
MFEVGYFEPLKREIPSNFNFVAVVGYRSYILSFQICMTFQKLLNIYERKAASKKSTEKYPVEATLFPIRFTHFIDEDIKRNKDWNSQKLSRRRVFLVQVVVVNVLVYWYSSYQEKPVPVIAAETVKKDIQRRDTPPVVQTAGRKCCWCQTSYNPQRKKINNEALLNIDNIFEVENEYVIPVGFMRELHQLTCRKDQFKLSCSSTTYSCFPASKLSEFLTVQIGCHNIGIINTAGAIFNLIFSKSQRFSDEWTSLSVDTELGSIYRLILAQWITNVIGISTNRFDQSSLHHDGEEPSSALVVPRFGTQIFALDGLQRLFLEGKIHGRRGRGRPRTACRWRCTQPLQINTLISSNADQVAHSAISHILGNGYPSPSGTEVSITIISWGVKYILSKSAFAFDSNFLELIPQHGPCSNYTDDNRRQLQRYIILLYDRLSECTKVDQSMDHMFAKERQIDRIPRTKAALIEHIKQAVFQARYI